MTALVAVISLAAGFGIGVVVCNIRDIKDLHEMEKILTEGHDRLVKEIEQKNKTIERLTGGCNDLQIKLMVDKEEIDI